MRKSKKFFALFLALALAICFNSGAVLAVDTDSPEGPIDPEPTTSYMRNLNSVTWTQVYTGTGTARNVTISSQAPYYCSVRMYESGASSPIWSETLSLAPLDTRIYYVGSNIARVEMKTVSSLGAVTVTYG